MKIIDKIVLDHQRVATPSRIHPTQFGLTAGKSGLHAAFILTECIAEAKDKGETLYCATLDVQKAFDVLQHPSLLDKLYAAGIYGPWWNIKMDSYNDLTSRVSWEGTISDNEVVILQGNGQGKLPSPDDYLTYLSDLLALTASTGLGYYLGSICVTTPTCADDMLVLDAQPEGLQATISLIEHYANAEHYTVHPIKSLVIPFNMRSETELQSFLEDEQIQVKAELYPSQTRRHTLVSNVNGYPHQQRPLKNG